MDNKRKKNDLGIAKSCTSISIHFKSDLKAVSWIRSDSGATNSSNSHSRTERQAGELQYQIFCSQFPSQTIKIFQNKCSDFKLIKSIELKKVFRGNSIWVTVGTILENCFFGAK